MIVTGKVSIVKQVASQWRQLGLVLIVSVAVVIAHEILNKRWISIQVTPLTALGVALGVFLSLRNNVVYARYWEGRTLLGRLVNVCRTLPRQATIYLTGGSGEEREAFHREICLRLIAFVKTFRAHLRDEPPGIHLPDYLHPDELVELAGARNLPAALLQRMGEVLRTAHRRGLIQDYHLTELDSSFTELTDILGGCERIKNTPLPPAYTYLAHKIMLAYCCLLPFGLVADIGLLTPVLSLVISFAFLTLDQTSDLIEIPFATEDNDLPLNALTRNIEIELLQAIGEKDVPPPLEPVNGILL